MADLDAQHTQANSANDADNTSVDLAMVDVVADADDGAVAIAQVTGGDQAPTPDDTLMPDIPAAWPPKPMQLPESDIHVNPGTMLADRYRLDTRVPTTLDNASAWKAVDRVLDRPVHAILLTGPTATAGLDAARRAALVSDPHLAKVLDVGTAVQNGRSHHYVITEPLGGETLAELVSEQPLDGATTRSIIGEAASALDAAERHGIHHVALRPDVVRVDDNRVLLSGLGMDADFAYTEGFSGDSAAHDALGLAALAYYAVSGFWPLDLEPAAAYRLHHKLLRSAPVTDDGYPLPLTQLVPGVDTKVAALAERAFGPKGNTLKSPYQVVEALRPWAPLVHQEVPFPEPVAVPAAAPVRNPIRNLTSARSIKGTNHTPTGRIPRLGRRPVTAQTVAVAPPLPMAAPRPSIIPMPPPPVAVAPTVVVTGRRKHGVVATPIVLGLAIATIVGGGAWAASSVFAPFVAPIDTSTPETEAPAIDPDEDTDANGTEVPIIRPVIVSATTIDPYGDGERPQNAEYAIDGDPGTYWYTYTYATSEFGGIKAGVGFWIELEQTSSVHQVMLYANGSGGSVEIRNTTPDDPSGGELLANGRFENQASLEFDAVELDGVMLWITGLPQLPDGRYRLELRTVTVQ